MLDRKVIISLIVALIALIVVGFFAMNSLPTGDVAVANASDNGSASTENVSVNVSESQADAKNNVTIKNITADDNDNLTVVSGGIVKPSDAYSNSSGIDSVDVLQKQVYVISQNDTAKNPGMEPGKYVVYSNKKDGIVKIEKIA